MKYNMCQCMDFFELLKDKKLLDKDESFLEVWETIPDENKEDRL